MSAHYSYYEKINGNSAFLSGAVSAYADTYLCKILPKHCITGEIVNGNKG